MLKFYTFWGPRMPHLYPIILHILSHRCVSTTAETVFSCGGYTLNNYRSVINPEKAELAILSAFIYKSSRSSNSTVPKLPDVGVMTGGELFMYTDGFEEGMPNAHLPDVK